MRGIKVGKAAILLVFFMSGGVFAPASAFADEPLARHFAARDESSSRSVDHSLWAGLLAQYLESSEDGINRFDYGRVSAADRALLDSYIEQLTLEIPTTLSRAQQLAYWINLYNALTVKVVLDHYPVRSIRQIKYGRWFAIGPWSVDLIEIEGFELSLDDIEHLILRPLFADPRIHYALNCASLGCPNLRAEPYSASRIHDQLDQAARAYINHPRGVRVEDGHLHTSSIYVWFKEDFGGSDSGVIDHLRQYAEPDLAAKLDGVRRIRGHSYDWALNEPEQGS